MLSRHTVRLQGFDYSQSGFYFVTICTQNRVCLFGKIENQTMVFSQFGRIVFDVWQTIPMHHNVVLDALQIMPNHLHAIVVIVGAGRDPPVNKNDPPVNINNQSLIKNNRFMDNIDLSVNKNCLTIEKTDLSAGKNCLKINIQRQKINTNIDCVFGRSHENVPCALHTKSKMESGGSRPAPTLGNIIGLVKSECTKSIKKFTGNTQIEIWQRGFYEHIIRNSRSYENIKKYILENPKNWTNDKLNR